MMEQFTPEGIGAKIFQERYAAHVEETWSEASWRVADHVSAVEEGEANRKLWRGLFFSEIDTGRFMPGGRIWYGSGRTGGQLLNCFVIPTGDSISEWGTTLSDLMQISALGGGVGINFSSIRPKGSTISRGGEASGPVSVMRMCDSVGEEIRGGGGRRVAMMHCLSATHPDVREFVHAKQVDGALKNANISLVLDHDVSEIPAYLWDDIVRGAWENGEPGILNKALADAESNVHYVHELISTNPCVTGDTVIATLDGPRTFRDLAETEEDVLVYAWHPETKKPVVKMMRRPHQTREVAHLLEVEFDSGLKVRCTDDHKFFSFRGDKVAAGHLRIGQSVRAWSMSEHRDGHLRVHGWDSETNSADHRWVSRMVWECFYGALPDGYIIHHRNGDEKDNRIENLGRMTPIEHNEVHYADRFAAGFDGTCKNHKVVAIRDAGFEAVYNGCVDDAHSYVILDPKPIAGIASGIISANCGEIWLPAYGNCCLGALVLPRFVHNGSFQWDWFERSVALGVRFLDDVLDANVYPLAETERMGKRERRLGLGVMGLHSMLLDLGMRYDAPDAMEFVSRLMSFMAVTAYKSSAALAKEKGVFDCFDQEITQSGYLRRHEELGEIASKGLRNCALLTVAPTGTTSMVHGITSGIEPLFAPAYDRKRYVGEHLVNELVVSQDYLDHGELAVGAYDIHPADHFEMQARVQNYVDNAVSKTINIPQGFDQQALSAVWKRFMPYVKGTTIYREGARDNEPLSYVPIHEVAARVSVHTEEFVSVVGVDPDRDLCEGGVCAL